MQIAMQLSDYQSSFVRELQAARVRFLVFGGMAMRAHGLERATHDLDLFIDRSKSNVKHLLPVIAKRFRNRPAGLTVEWLSLPDKLVPLPGNEQNEIDILTSSGALDFASAFTNRIEVSYQDLIMPVIGLREFIYSKIASADRSENPKAVERDILDLAALLRLWDPRHNKQRHQAT